MKFAIAATLFATTSALTSEYNGDHMLEDIPMELAEAGWASGVTKGTSKPDLSDVKAAEFQWMGKGGTLKCDGDVYFMRPYYKLRCGTYYGHYAVMDKATASKGYECSVKAFGGDPVAGSKNKICMCTTDKASHEATKCKIDESKNSKGAGRCSTLAQCKGDRYCRIGKCYGTVGTCPATPTPKPIVVDDKKMVTKEEAKNMIAKTEKDVVDKITKDFDNLKLEVLK